MSDFTARLYRVGFPPDADGDTVLAGAIKNGARAVVSLDWHDTMRDPTLEPAGEAVLRHQGESVVGEGQIFDTPRGRELRKRLRERGGAQQWSVGYRVLESRHPTPEELRTYPDTKRVIVRWALDEVSPVTLGACGPTCRTLAAKSVKCACGCGCDVRDVALKELARFEALRARLLLPELSRQIAELKPFADAESKQLDPATVPAEVRAAGEWGAKAGTVLSGSRRGTPPIVWLDPASENVGFGFASTAGGSIYVKALSDPEDVVFIAAHEAVHGAGVKDETECSAIAELALTGWRALKAKRPEPTPMPTTYWALLRAMQSGT